MTNYGPLATWDVSCVTDMTELFCSTSLCDHYTSEASSFNADLGDWDVSKVTAMAGMFNGATAFNGDLSDWDVAKVTTMQVMFLDATKFRRTLGWCVDENVVLTGAFYGTKCADGVEAAEDQYVYHYYTYGVPDDFANEAEAVALAAACGVDVRADC